MLRAENHTYMGVSCGSYGPSTEKERRERQEVNIVNRSWRKTAIHEAGHAIAACVLGRRFDYVDAPHPTDLRGRSAVGEVGSSSGVNVDTEKWTITDGSARRFAEEEAIFRLAGGLACDECGFAGAGYEGTSNDLQVAANVLKWTSTDDADRQARTQAVIARAAEIVKAHRAVIEILAGELQSRGRLQYGEVVEIFEASKTR